MTLNHRYLRWLLWLLLTVSCGTLAVFSGITLYLNPKLPKVETLRQVQLQIPLRVYSSDGLLIGEYGEKRRTPIEIEQVPQALIHAFLAAEDDRFYSHPGVDIKSLLRAASQLLQSGQIQTGGSTITMQVARNFFLSRKQTFSRKFNEILLALKIEKELTKEEILELYLNKIYLGNRAYGIAAAAQVYYGKSIDELNLAQLAMIAGLPKAPSAYNPLANPRRALVRRNWILGRMLSLGYIDATAHKEAISQLVNASYHGSRLQLHAPYIAEMARKEAVDALGEAAYTDGFKIYTTVDAQLQARAQRAVIEGLLNYDGRHGYRGPEGQLPTGSIAGQTPDADTTAKGDTQLPLEEWQQALATYRTVGGLLAAAVTRVHENSIDILTVDGRQASIPWDHGLASVRPYISEDRTGPAPEKAADLFSVGDVVRTREAEDGWHLSQVPAAQAALVSLNPDNGAIRALVGGFDFAQSHFNRATQAERQPGSSFKPFIYTAALEQGLTPATLINDAPIVFDDASLEGTWRPENASGRFYGPTRLRKALFQSRNLVSIRILRSIGVQQAIDGMSRYGFDESQLPRDLSLALGSHAVTPLQMATGFAVFANGGYRVEPYLVERIETVDGERVLQAMPATVCRKCESAASDSGTLEELTPAQTPLKNTAHELESLTELEQALAARLATEFNGSNKPNTETESEPATVEEQPPAAERVISARVAYIMDDMLRDVVRRGTGRRAMSLGRNDLAGKTGTTNGPKDAWFAGYNHHLVTTTWLGFDQNSNLGRREYGGTSALPIWIDFMELALDGVPEAPRRLPDGLVTVRIDPETGLRAHAGQQDAIFEVFRAENVPPFAEESAPNLNNGGSGGQEAFPEDLF